MSFSITKAIEFNYESQHRSQVRVKSHINQSWDRYRRSLETLRKELIGVKNLRESKVALSLGRRPSKMLVDSLITRESLGNLELEAKVRHKSKEPRSVKVRWKVCAELRDLGFSLPGIGNRLGLDHSTVFNAVKRYHGKPPKRVGKAIDKFMVQEGVSAVSAVCEPRIAA